MCGIISNANCTIVEVVHKDGHRVSGVMTWADGFSKVKQPQRRENDDDILARMMWLVKHDRREEADELLASI